MIHIPTNNDVDTCHVCSLHAARSRSPIDEHNRGSGILQNIVGLRRREMKIYWDDGCSGNQSAKIGKRRFDRILRKDRNPPNRAKTQRI